MMLSVPLWENPWVVVAFLIFTGSAFGMNLLVILIATLACLWGPGNALLRDGSLQLLHIPHHGDMALLRQPRGPPHHD